MFTRARLLAESSTIDSSAADPAATAEAVAAQLRGRTLKIRGLGQGDLRWPKHRAGFDGLVTALAQFGIDYPGGAEIGRELLEYPPRAWRLAGSQIRAGKRTRRFLLVGAYDLAGGGSPAGVAVAELVVVDRPAKPKPCESVAGTLRWLEGPEAVTEMLEQTFLSVDEEARKIPSGPVVAWLGAEAAADADQTWKTRVSAVAAVLGLGTLIVEHPQNRKADTGSRLRDSKAMLLVLRGDDPGSLSDRQFYESCCPMAEVLTLGEDWPFDEAIGFLRLALEDVATAIDPSTTALEPEVDSQDSLPTKTLDDVRNTAIALRSEAFVVTDNALEVVAACGHTHPERLLDGVVRLASAARDWREASCQTDGRLVDWLYVNYGLRVALYDGTISKSASQFSYEEVDYSRLPHVKLGEAQAFNSIGRIYFAIDAPRQRFIVDHIGLHL